MQAKILEIQTELANSLERELKRFRERREFLETHATAIAELADAGITGDFCGWTFDFNELNHEQAVKVMLAIPGTWTKRYNCAGGIDYILNQDNPGLHFRIWNGGLPPSCKLVETEVEVPARIEKRYQVVCNEEPNA